MHGIVVSAMRLVLVTAFGGLTLLAVVLLPWLAADMAFDAPEYAFLRVPLLVPAVATVVCVQVGVVCVWRLLSLAAADAVFGPRARRHVDVFVGAAALATALVAGVEAYLVLWLGEPGGPGGFLVLTALVVTGAGITLLMLVLRALLVQATQQRAELAEVV